jgi:magnesium transporter
MLKTFQLTDAKICTGAASSCPIMVYINPDEAEKKQLTAGFHLDEHTLQSALDPDEQSRLEFEPEHLAMILKRPKNYSAKEQFLFKTESYGLFLFKDKLVVVVSEDIPLFEGKQFQRVKSLNEVCLKLINRFILHFVEHLKIINMISESLESKINASMENKYLLNLFTLEKSLVYYLNAINSNSNVIERIKASAAKIGLATEELEYLEDIIIENNQCYKQAEIYSTVLAGLMDARVSVVSNNLNVLMKTLNIITIGIMVPTLVVSIFSMNVRIPFQYDHPASFWIIMALAAISVICLYYVWRKKKW